MVQAVSQVWFSGFQHSHSGDLVNTALRNVPDLFFRLSKDLILLDYFAKVTQNEEFSLIFFFFFSGFVLLFCLLFVLCL